MYFWSLSRLRETKLSARKLQKEIKSEKAIIAFAALAALSIPSLADPGNGNGFGQGDGGGRDHKMNGVPGPLVGAGLPFLAVGYGGDLLETF
jgi:hypothetical protein